MPPKTIRSTLRTPRRLPLLVALALALCPALAHAITLTGVVVDASGNPVEFANVTVAALQAGAVADDQGRFRLELPAGRHELAISQMGYLTSRRGVQVAAGVAELRVVLADEPVAIAEVVVCAS